MKYKGKRNLQLDILRGLAILLVLGRHIELLRPGGIAGAVVEIWFRIGWLGVDLFFVLSGFLIGGLLVTEIHTHGKIDIARFLIRRGLKIYPPYFVFISYVILMPTVKVLVNGGDAWATLTEGWVRYWPNLLFLQNYVGSNPAAHTWTLAVEEHFYLMLPFGLVVLEATRHVRALVPLCLFVIPTLVFSLRCLSVWMDDSFAMKMSATHLRLDALLFGVGIRGVAQYYPNYFMAARQWRGWLLATGLILWSFNVFIEPGTIFIRTAGLTATYFGSAAFLMVVYHTHGDDFGDWKRWISLPATLLAWIGVYSYAIYLWHVTVTGGLTRELVGRIPSLAVDPSPVVWMTCAASITAGAVLAGIVTSKLVEWPVLHVRDKFFPSRSGFLLAIGVATAGLPQRGAARPIGTERLNDQLEVVDHSLAIRPAFRADTPADSQ